MRDERKRAWAGVFEMFAACWPRFGKPTPNMVRTWELALHDLTDIELVNGAVHLVRHHGSFPPSPGELREAVRGKPKSIPIFATDVHGRRILKASGEPVVERWETVRETASVKLLMNQPVKDPIR